MRLGLLVLTAALLGACETPQGDPPEGAPSAADEVACREEARQRFKDIPAVRSGRTVYVPGAEESFYEECLRRPKPR